MALTNYWFPQPRPSSSPTYTRLPAPNFSRIGDFDSSGLTRTQDPYSPPDNDDGTRRDFDRNSYGDSSYDKDPPSWSVRGDPVYPGMWRGGQGRGGPDRAAGFLDMPFGQMGTVSSAFGTGRSVGLGRGRPMYGSRAFGGGGRRRMMQQRSSRRRRMY